MIFLSLKLFVPTNIPTSQLPTEFVALMFSSVCACPTRTVRAISSQCSPYVCTYVCAGVGCPPCFNSVPEKYTTALELYQLLEAQINFTLAGDTVGVSPSLLNMLMEYHQLLEELLQRINVALIL